MIPKVTKTGREIIRIAGRLNEVVTIFDNKGKILHKVISPVMVEFYPRDLMQVLVGAAILAIPVALTEEVWNLGITLPILNIILLILLSLVFIGTFVYYNFYKKDLKEHKKEFFKRTFSIYICSFFVVALLLSIIQKAPWSTDFLLAFKRTVIIAFPASMSASISDMIK